MNIEELKKLREDVLNGKEKISPDDLEEYVVIWDYPTTFGEKIDDSFSKKEIIDTINDNDLLSEFDRHVKVTCRKFWKIEPNFDFFPYAADLGVIVKKDYFEDNFEYSSEDCRYIPKDGRIIKLTEENTLNNVVPVRFSFDDQIAWEALLTDFDIGEFDRPIMDHQDMKGFVYWDKLIDGISETADLLFIAGTNSADLFEKSESFSVGKDYNSYLSYINLLTSNFDEAYGPTLMNIFVNPITKSKER